MSTETKLSNLILALVTLAFGYFATMVVYNYIVPHIWNLPKIDYVQAAAISFLLSYIKLDLDKQVDTSPKRLGEIITARLIGIAVAWVLNYFLTH